MDSPADPIPVPPSKLHNAFCYARDQEKSLDGKFPLRMAGTCRSVLRYMILFANHTPSDYAGHTIARGEIAASQEHLAAQTGFSRKSIRNALKHLQNQNEICQKGAIEGANGIIVYRIVNYELWDAAKKKGPAKGQPKGQQGATLKEGIKEESKETTYPVESGEALKIWTAICPLPSGASTDKALDTLSKLHRVDGLTWERIATICRYGAAEWGLKGYCDTPGTLREWTSKKDMRVWQKMESQMGKHRNGSPTAAPYQRPYIISERSTLEPYTDPEERRHWIKIWYPNATKDPDQGHPFTLSDDYLAQPDTYISPLAKRFAKKGKEVSGEEVGAV